MVDYGQIPSKEWSLEKIVLSCKSNLAPTRHWGMTEKYFFVGMQDIGCILVAGWLILMESNILSKFSQVT